MAVGRITEPDGPWVGAHDVDGLVMTHGRVVNEIDREKQMERSKNVVASLF
jgi:hypothetical protein